MEHNNEWNSNEYETQNTSENQNVFEVRNTFENQNVYGNPDIGKPKKKKRSFKGFGWAVVKCVVLAVIFGLISGGIFMGMNRIGAGDTKETENMEAAESNDNGQRQDTVVQEGKLEQTPTAMNAQTPDVSGIVENAMPSIVSITNMTETEYRDWWGQTDTYAQESCGSGVILSQDEENLYIATNNHVVEGATTITVSFIDDTTATAEVKGTDASSDLAVVSIPVSSLSEETLGKIKVATLGNSEELVVGETAIAIGNALGYGQSVTTGVISAVNREVTLTDETNGQNITNELIQTDAAINPGNSGGALLNLKGEVIGINSAKFASSTIEGMGFAIPISTAGPILNDLITREIVEEAKSAYLGISGVDVSEEVAATYNMPEGIYVARVYESTAAESCGLMKGDIITSFDGKKVNSMAELQERMQYYEAGTEVELVIRRASNGEYAEQTLKCVLGSKK